MKFHNVKTDLHTHVVSNLEESGVWERIWVDLLGNRRVKSLEEFVIACSRQNQNTLVGITNFSGNGMYETIMHSIEKMPKSIEIYDEHKDVYIGARSEKGFWHFFLRTEEIPTDKTRVLVAGSREDIGTRNLEEVLRISEERGYLTVALRPENKFMNRIAERILHRQKNLCLSKESFEKYSGRFDVLEVFNSSYPRMFSENERLAKENHIPGIYSSEAYRIDSLFNGNFTMEEIDFSNPKSLITSIKKGLQERRYFAKIVREKGFFENALHKISTIYAPIAISLGLLKEKKYYE